jgi:hypothetical protein
LQVQKFKVFAILAGVLLSTSALAQQTTPATAPATAPTAAPATTAQPAATTTAATVAPGEDPDERICRSGEPILGSRFPGPRVCHTRKEWAQIQQDSQNALYHQQMERSSGGGK